jgi:hypothetical protein
MSFPASACLRTATSRAKSDVANKLVSMFLHDLSRKICASLQCSITDARYAEAVEAVFGSSCCYCYRPLERDRISVEHLEGMNRFRLGLHIPGNVVVSCRRCNGEKRRDDQLDRLILAEYGWGSFLSHDSMRCGTACNTCLYWRTVWPDPSERADGLRNSRQKITAFRSQYPASLQWGRSARLSLRQTVDSLYRSCQEFATSQIRKNVDEAFSSLKEDVGLHGVQVFSEAVREEQGSPGGLAARIVEETGKPSVVEPITLTLDPPAAVLPNNGEAKILPK